MHALWGVAAASLLAWIGLLVGRGLFWWPLPRLDSPEASLEPEDWAGRSVVAVIPARNEAQILPHTLPTVLTQDYRGPFRVVLVDDRSEDETASVARAAAEESSAEDRLTILRGEPLAAGWSGKVWAMQQGAAAASAAKAPEFLWFTDADIAHEPWVLSALVARAEVERLDLVSTMATLRVNSAWDRLLVPAFVYFFAKLYPFRFVGDPRRRTAGAAGGCILVRGSVLERAGGLAAVGSALIDDCALGRLIKRAGGRIWLGFSRGVRSVRGYGSLAERLADGHPLGLHPAWALPTQAGGDDSRNALPLCPRASRLRWRSDRSGVRCAGHGSAYRDRRGDVGVDGGEFRADAAAPRRRMVDRSTAARCWRPLHRDDRLVGVAAHKRPRRCVEGSNLLKRYLNGVFQAYRQPPATAARAHLRSL